MLVNWDWSLLGFYSYLTKLLTCLSDTTLSTTLKFGFNSFSIAWLKLIPFDFQIKQKLFLCIFNAIFLSVIFLGYTLNPS